MKFKEMSWQELKEDFEKILNKFSVEELVESLREYEVISEQYSYEFPKDNNLVEEYQFSIVNIEKEPTSINMNNDKKEELIIDENINWEVAA